MAKPVILLVDDDQIQATKLVEMVKKLGLYTLKWSQNGLDALTVVRDHQKLFGMGKNRLDLILLDFDMPTLSGPQFLNQLRQDEEKILYKQPIPVIFLTAPEDQDQWGPTLKDQAVGYLKKPFTPESISDLLASHFTK